jgi:protein gp37/ParB-like chromosome segregation protein Spo0J
MTDYGRYKVHPLADAFPLIEGDEFKLLVDDIRENGLGQPIVLTADESTIVDGRNRYRACVEALVDPNFRLLPKSTTEEQIVDFIVSENLRRRDLNPGQRAMLAVEIEKHLAKVAKERQRAAGGGNGRAGGDTRTVVAPGPQPLPKPDLKSREQAASTTGTSGRSVQRAKYVDDNAPDLAEKVTRGEMALKDADRQARARVAEQRKHEPEPLKPKPAPVLLTLRTHDGQEVEYPKAAGAPTFNLTPGPGISWADWSWNPVTGCLHGCDYCYARAIATSERYANAYPAGFTPLYHPERLQAPANTKPGPGARGRVFVCSMADLYGRWVPQDWIDAVHEVELGNPQWEYLHLTKFPDRYVGLKFPDTAWVGTSVDEQKRVRIAERAFAQIDDVSVKWLSLEPLLEPLEFSDLSMFDWVVIGAQTATNQPSGHVPAFAPPFEWVARIVLQALDAGCRVHMKPNLAGNPGMQLLNEYPGGEA